MALAILPQDRGSADRCAETADLNDLTAELIASELLTPFEAETQAVTLMDELATYAAVWDTDAALAGHPNACPGLAALTVTPWAHPIPLALVE